MKYLGIGMMYIGIIIAGICFSGAWISVAATFATVFWIKAFFTALAVALAGFVVAALSK
jgi:hypothetical protein